MDGSMDEPLTEFRGRCRTWPSKADGGEDSSGIDSPSNFTPVGSTARLPSLGVLNECASSTWSPNSSGPSGDSFFSVDAPPASADLPKPKRTRRRNPDAQPQRKTNPWGEESYAELIVRALEGAPEGRLRLNEIYEWFSANVPFFAERSTSEASAGWKNSIRHNLSLHSRFMRVQNEGAGKSSWWVINPDAKPGRNPRRRAATMDQSTKAAIEKKRRGARKRLEVRGSMQGLAESVAGSQLSMASHDFDLNDDNSLGPNFEKFRARTQSNVSNLGGPPSPQNFFDDDLPPWANPNGSAAPVPPPTSNPNAASNISEILDRANEMRLDEMEYRPMGAVKEPLQPQQHRSSPQMPMHQIKQEEPEPMGMPPPYQEMNLMQSPSQRSNMIHPQMPQHHMPQQPKMMAAPQNNGATPPQYFQQQSNLFNMPPPMISQQQAPPSSSIGGHWMSQPQIMQQAPHQMQFHHPTSQPMPPMMNGGGLNGGLIMSSSSQPSLHMRPPVHRPYSQHNDLPMDLENLDTFDPQVPLTCDVQAVIEMEIKAQRNAPLQFDF
ncbi:Daf-16-1 protein 2 [Aphelenchoides fujianensis]|nr:Daf-16-1 protein 2 [Aphelenchoides fujianensis]